MTFRQRFQRPPWSTLLLFCLILAGLGMLYLAWSPGSCVRDGAHDRRTNGIWLQHGWLGDDVWFHQNHRDPDLFRTEPQLRALAQRLSGHGIKFVYPHLCPCRPNGQLPAVDAAQTERFLDQFHDFSVIPWIGGVYEVQCLTESPEWRSRFVASAAALLTAHPRLAGVHVNIEPMPSGTAGFLILLEELRRTLPKGKLISVAAYPPPSRWHPYPEVHWDEGYFRQVAQRVDQLVPMLYDTAIKVPKLYQHVMAAWTQETLAWAGETPVLLGVPAYEDAGCDYHVPRVENLPNAFLGIHAGLNSFPMLPANYAGIAIYCEWTMDDAKWATFKREFEKNEKRGEEKKGNIQ